MFFQIFVEKKDYKTIIKNGSDLLSLWQSCRMDGGGGLFSLSFFMQTSYLHNYLTNNTNHRRKQSFYCAFPTPSLSLFLIHTALHMLLPLCVYCLEQIPHSAYLVPRKRRQFQFRHQFQRQFQFQILNISRLASLQ